VAEHKQTEGERVAISPTQASDGSGRPVDGIDERTNSVNPDGGNEYGGSAGPVGQFEGEGNEGTVAPLGGDVAKSAKDGEANSQGGVASGAPN
jgi:hypothetical protein